MFNMRMNSRSTEEWGSVRAVGSLTSNVTEGQVSLVGLCINSLMSSFSNLKKSENKGTNMS